MAVSVVTVLPSAKAHIKKDGGDFMLLDKVNGIFLVVMWYEPHVASPPFSSGAWAIVSSTPGISVTASRTNT